MCLEQKGYATGAAFRDSALLPPSVATLFSEFVLSEI